MQDDIKIGVNYTGIHMSPLDSEDLIQITQRTQPDVAGNSEEFVRAHKSSIDEAEGVGSVSIPGTIRGAVNTAVDVLTGSNLAMFLDKLGERLAFERAGVRLYDALLTKAISSHHASADNIKLLQRFRNQELEHFKIVALALEQLGADPTSQTPCADLSGVEGRGLLAVVTDPRANFNQSLQALLIAELTDNAGWELLIKLAEQNGQHKLIGKFQHALNQELEHLKTIKLWVEKRVLNEEDI